MVVVISFRIEAINADIRLSANTVQRLRVRLLSGE
jgi:hypothetical protein